MDEGVRTPREVDVPIPSMPVRAMEARMTSLDSRIGLEAILSSSGSTKRLNEFLQSLEPYAFQAF